MEGFVVLDEEETETAGLLASRRETWSIMAEGVRLLLPAAEPASAALPAFEVDETEVAVPIAEDWLILGVEPDAEPDAEPEEGPRKAGSLPLACMAVSYLSAKLTRTFLPEEPEPVFSSEATRPLPCALWLLPALLAMVTGRESELPPLMRFPYWLWA